jgi:hypothetical protein
MKTEFYQQLCAEEEKLQNLIDAIRVLKKNYELNQAIPVIDSSLPAKTNRLPLPKQTGKKSLGKKLDVVASQYYNAYNNPVDKYDKKLTQIQKVLYALQLLKRADKDEIAHKITELEPSLKIEKAVKFTGYHSSKLKTLGIIGGIKSGYKNIYSIKE